MDLQKRDQEILTQMLKEFGAEDRKLYFNYKSKKNSNFQDMVLMSIKNQKFHDDLTKYGIVPQKTKILKYPDFLQINQHSHFLRGVMDGDGCIHPYNGHNAAVDICGTYDFCNGAKQVIEDILRIHCSLIAVHKNINDTYRISISGRIQVTTFLNWIYEDAEMYLQRKYDLYKKYYCNNSVNCA